MRYVVFSFGIKYLADELMHEAHRKGMEEQYWILAVSDRLKMTLTNHAAAIRPTTDCVSRTSQNVCAIADSVPPCSASVSVALASAMKNTL